MGGTTAKICLIDGLEPQMTRTFEVGRVYRNLKGSASGSIPAREMVEIGAGGGSIAHVDRMEDQVGPESAGSEPGPASYGRGEQSRRLPMLTFSWARSIPISSLAGV